jgi:type IV pilus assembly protein PilM
MVVAKIGRGPMQLEDAHSHRIPPEVNADDPERMGRYIAQMLEVHQLRFKQVILDVPRDKAVITRLRLSPTPANEVAAAVRFQAQRELPFSLEEAEIDFVVVQRDESKLATEVLLAAVRLETLNGLVATCKAAGLVPVRMGLRPYANVVSVASLPATLDQRVLFIDVGPAMTEIDVIRGRRLEFSRSANVGVPFHGGELVGDDSRVSSKAELSHVELVDTAHHETLDELMLEVTRTLQAFRATEDDAAIDQVIVGGGTGIEPALVDELDERLGLPVTLFDPTPTLGVPEHESTKLRAFGSTLGLAWGIGKGGLELDFLNPKRPLEKHADLKRQLRLAGLAAVVVVVAIGGWVINERISLNQQYAQLRQVNASLRKELMVYYEIDNRVLGAHDWETGSRMGVALEHLLEITEQAVGAGKQLLISDISFRATNGRITIKLVASNQKTAEGFTKRLNDLEIDGKKPYVAQLGPWQQTKTIDDKFTGRADVSVEIVELAAFVAGQKDRDKQRETRIKNLKRGVG